MVVDASVLVEFLAGGEFADQAARRIRRAAPDLWAPHLIDAEVGHVLRRAVLAGELTPRRAAQALAELANFPIQRVGHTELLHRAWQLRSNASFYDAIYLALAEALALPLVTLDARLARAPGSRARIELLGSVDASE